MPATPQPGPRHDRVARFFDIGCSSCQEIHPARPLRQLAKARSEPPPPRNGKEIYGRPALIESLADLSLSATDRIVSPQVAHGNYQFSAKLGPTVPVGYDPFSGVGSPTPRAPRLHGLTSHANPVPGHRQLRRPDSWSSQQRAKSLLPNPAPSAIVRLVRFQRPPE